MPDSDDTPCAECDGDGLDQCGQFKMVDRVVVWDICEACGGTGTEGADHAD